MPRQAHTELAHTLEFHRNDVVGDRLDNGMQPGLRQVMIEAFDLIETLRGGSLARPSTVRAINASSYRQCGQIKVGHAERGLAITTRNAVAARTSHVARTGAKECNTERHEGSAGLARK
jgi:hypothetical protein